MKRKEVTRAQVQQMALEFRRAGENMTEAWEATALTLLDRLNESEARTSTLAEVCGRLCCEAQDMVRSRWAWKQLQDGFRGMGHNILVEKCGLWQSIHGWSRLGKAAETVDNKLTELFYEDGSPRW